MIQRAGFRGALVALALASVAALPATAQYDGDKRPLNHDDYDSWKRSQGERISDDGRWILYIAAPQEGDGELIVRNVEAGTEYRHPRGTDARFSAAGSHAVFLVEPPEEEVKAAEKEDVEPEDMPKSALGIMDLTDGSVVTVERVKSYLLPEDNGGWVAYLKEKPVSEPAETDTEAQEPEEPEAAEGEEGAKKKEDFGTDLVLRSLADGSEWTKPWVLEYVFTKDAGYLFYTVSSESDPDTDGLYAYRPAAGIGSELLTGEGNYRRMALDENETKLAFVTDRDTWDQEVSTFALYGWNVGDAAASLWVSHDSTPGFPAGLAVSDQSEVSFNEAGDMVLFGIKEIPEPQAEDDEAEDEEKAVFDLWHWNDPYPQPQQIQIADDVRDETWETVYHLDSGKLVRLADEAVPDVRLPRRGTVAYAATAEPYTKLVSWDGRYSDLYVIDPESGERTLVAERIRGFSGAGSLSPGERYLTWFDHRDYEWYAHDITTGQTVAITGSIDARFDREDHDRPEPANSYGMAGWTDGDASILIYDRYDIWEVRPDGSNARMITEGFGRANDLSFRYVRLDPEERSIDPGKRLLLRATNEQTMATGFWWDQVEGDDAPTEIVMVDRSLGVPTKAENADVLLYTQSRFDLYPDLWVSGFEFDGEKVSDLGDQLDEFLWGSAELRDFLSADGMPLKGILIKPEGFDPNNDYPLLVYIYETLHQGLHGFRHPSPGTSVSPSYYVSNGYVMWMPDIEYHTGYPGKDALKCVLPGINMLVNEGFVDADRIGIQGHSWGGYQIAYMVTQTDIFTAAEAGAPVSNMTSAYGGIRWQSGMVRQFQYEQTQSRLGASLWEVPLRYIENSPLFWADKIDTPLLILHNDEDGAVPWYQGIELIMALRRLGKPSWMFNYNGEAHGLRQRVNQEDWTVRMQEFFDHYLKDGPEPEWMAKGIKAWEKDGSGQRESPPE